MTAAAEIHINVLPVLETALVRVRVRALVVLRVIVAYLLLTQDNTTACGQFLHNTYIFGLIRWGKPPYRYDPAHCARYVLFFWRHNRLYKTFFALTCSAVAFVG